MICFHHQIQDSINLIKQELSWPVHVQKIYSSARFINIQAYGKGKTYHLYFGRGKGFEGIWLGDQTLPVKLRQKDRFLEFLRKHISSLWLYDINLDPRDRKVDFTFQQKGSLAQLSLFWKGRELYFLWSNPEIRWASWKGETNEDIDLLWHELELGAHDLSEKNKKPVKMMADLLRDELDLLQKHSKSKAQKKKEKKIELIQKDIERLNQIEKISPIIEAEIPERFMEGDAWEKFGFKYKFKTVTAYKRREELYQWLKRLKNARILQSQRLQDLTTDQKQKSEEEVVSTIPIISPVWKVEKKSKPLIRQLDGGYKIEDFGDYKIGVGLNAQGNDQLRKIWASDLDMWVHGKSGPSAHAIIKAPLVTINMIIHAGKVLAKHSGFQGTELEVIYTQVKNVKGVPKNPGMVTYKKEKTLKLQLSEES